MITKISINGFKSISQLDLDLGEINLFIGPNGSGKSNLLEAIGVLGAAAFGRVDDESLLRRGVRPGLPALYKTSFKGESVRPFIQISANFVTEAGEASYSAGLHNPIKDPNPNWHYQNEHLVENGEKLVGRSPASKSKPNKEAGSAALEAVNLAKGRPAGVLLDLLREYVVYTPTTDVLRGIRTEPKRNPLGLSGGGLAEAWRDTFRSRFSTKTPINKRTQFRKAAMDAIRMIGWVDAIGASNREDTHLSPSVQSPGFVVSFFDKYMSPSRNKLTGYDASEGALFVLFALILAASPAAPSFFAIDNFDHGLNPRLARALMKSFIFWCKEEKKQVLLTTHNPLVLDAIDLTDDTVRLFTVDRTERGLTSVKRVILNKALLKKAEDGWPLSRLWVMGMIGGVPNV